MRTARRFGLLRSLILSSLLLLGFASHACALQKAAVPQNPKAAPQSPKAAPQNPRESELRQKIGAEVRSNRALLGAWIRVKSDPANPASFEFQPFFDSANAKEQQAEFENFVKTLPSSNTYHIAAPKTWPFSQLIESLQSKIRSERSVFGGAGLRGAFFVFDDNSQVLTLVLVGHVAPGKKGKLATACDNLLETSDEWKGFQKTLKIVASPDQLEAKAPVNPLAQSLRSKLAKAVQTSRALLGSWVEVVHNPDVPDPENKAGNHPGKFKFLLRVDAAKEAEQQRQLTALVRELLPSQLQSSPIECRSWPFTSWLRNFQSAVASRKADLRNCAIRGAYFALEQNAGVLQMVLLGHVASSATPDVQRQKIAQLCDESLTRNPQWTEWQKTYKILANPDKLSVGPPVNRFAESLRTELAKTLSSKKSLEGAWLDLVHHPDVLEPESRPGTFSIQVVVEVSRATAQEAELKQAVKAIVPREYMDESDPDKWPVISWPITRLLGDLQRRLDADPGFEGCKVCSADIVAENESTELLDLKLQGRATSEKRRNDIGQLCDRLMKVTSDFDWTKPIYGRELHTTPTSMQICNLSQLAKDVERPLIEALHECRKTSALLNGVSFDVQATIPPQDCDCGSPHFVIRPIIDVDRLQMRLEAATNLVKSNCAKLQYTVAEPVTLPIRQLLENVQDQIEFTPGLEGALLLDAALDKVDPTTKSPKQFLEIRLIGRVADPGQNARIAQLCQKVIDEHECTPSEPKGCCATGLTLSPSATTLLVVPYSQSAAARFFNDGLEYFKHHRYRKAHGAFRLAYAHSPANVEYQYWLVLCELELKQPDRAYRRLKPLVWKTRGPNGSENEYTRVLFSLEPAQGCVRQRLVSMEDRAMAELPPTLR